LIAACARARRRLAFALLSRDAVVLLNFSGDQEKEP
jgi:hypothetical protein